MENVQNVLNQNVDYVLIAKINPKENKDVKLSVYVHFGFFQNKLKLINYYIFP